MKYPDQYKCLTCKFRYYGCKVKNNRKGLLSCIAYQRRQVNSIKSWCVSHRGISLARCLFGVCVKRLNR